MKKYFILTLFTFSVSAFSQTQIDLCSGGSGTTTGVPQSYNEGREADITIISSSNVGISSMTLSGFCTGGTQGLVGARIYDSGTHAVLFSRDSVVNNMYNGTVTIPVSFVLLSWQSYRVGFYCYGYGNNHNSGSGFMYQPTFPYNESNNFLRVNQAYESNPDTFPNNFNIYLPFIKLGYKPLGINEFSMNSPLSIYPNPCTTQTVLESKEFLKEAVLTVFNSQGQIAKQMTNINGQKILLNRDNLPVGLYLVQLSAENKIISTNRLMVVD